MPEKDTKKIKARFPRPLLIILIVLVLLITVGAVLFKIFETRISSKFLSLFFSKMSGQAVNVEDGGKKISVDSKDGEFSYSAEGKLPEGFPVDFPIYPGAKLTNSWTADTDDGKGISVVWESKDTAETVKNFYKEKLAAGGWTIESELAQAEMQSLSFTKDNVSGFVGLTLSGDKLTISVTLGFK